MELNDTIYKGYLIRETEAGCIVFKSYNDSSGMHWGPSITQYAYMEDVKHAIDIDAIEITWAEYESIDFLHGVN